MDGFIYIASIMTDSQKQYDPLYLQGIEYFNEYDFFEAHEAWEDLWSQIQGDARKFYQGLIQVAVALHHFGNGNIRGARKLYHSSSKYLQPYRPIYEGIDLDKLLENFKECFEQVLHIEEEFPMTGTSKIEMPKIEMPVERIPKIQLMPIDPGTS